MSGEVWRRFKALIVCAALAWAAAIPSPAVADSRAPATTSFAGGEIAYAALPREARQTLDVIKRGGPFKFDRDGVVFGNYERHLPPQRRGYYREYTVPTPGVKHRGARRIVAGAGAEYYYSDDHYRSFRRIRE